MASAKRRRAVSAAAVLFASQDGLRIAELFVR